MVELKPPRQISLVREQFPKDSWATTLVNALNQFALETVQALRVAGVKYKTIDFTTGSAVANSFPIDIPVEAIPSEVRVAAVLSGTPASAVTPQWQPIYSPNPCIRLSLLTGLSTSTAYSIRLAYQ